VGNADGTGDFVGESECCALAFVDGSQDGFPVGSPVGLCDGVSLEILTGFLLGGSDGELLTGICVG
jgi:hypothetical protein